MRNNIKENQVEEALISDLDYLRRLIGLTYDIKIIARQFRLKSGKQRLDILLSHQNEICLIELKITPFSNNFINQVNDYRNELILLQKEKRLFDGNIQAFLLVTEYRSKDIIECISNNIQLIRYNPLDVLNNYYSKLSTIADFLTIKPCDYGVINLGLINKTLSKIDQGSTDESSIAESLNLSQNSIHNHLKIAGKLGLVTIKKKKYHLKELGNHFLNKRDKDISDNTISNEQTKFLRDFIAKDPFYSNMVFGVYSIIESVFILSRNSYPIEFTDLIEIFRIVSGKQTEWKSQKGRQTATYTYLNYAINLSLLAKFGSKVVITPDGFRFMLMLQLHKSIKMIESLSLGIRE